MTAGWIDSESMRAFEAEATDAYRLWTGENGWVERLGEDVLLSFKNETAPTRVTSEYSSWAEAAETSRMKNAALVRIRRIGPFYTGEKSDVNTRGD